MSPSEIREARRQLDMTQTELGQKLGYTQRTVMDWETGNQLPRPVVVLALKCMVEKNAKV
jgi:DNA-binding transcriptional regulator YiaG